MCALAMMKLVIEFYHRLRHITATILGTKFNELRARFLLLHIELEPCWRKHKNC